jgi:hypothetical protein
MTIDPSISVGRIFAGVLFALAFSGCVGRAETSGIDTPVIAHAERAQPLAAEAPGSPAAHEQNSPSAPLFGKSAIIAGQPQSTSSTPLRLGTFSTVPTPLRNFPRVVSTGRCAPIYRNGTSGSCIAEKPCRGYGIRNDEKQVLCMCYTTNGGCDTQSRCDAHVHACIPDNEESSESE